MNKRQRKKLEKKLFISVRDLNDDVALSDNLPRVTDEQVWGTVNEIKVSKCKINRTLKDYKRFILDK